MRSSEVCTNPGGGILNGGAEEDFLDAETTHVIEGISDSIGFRTKAADTGKEQQGEARKFLDFCRTSKAKSASDSIVLYASGRLGQVSGERLVACCNQVTGSLTLVGVKSEEDVRERIREIVRYANLLCPQRQ